MKYLCMICLFLISAPSIAWDHYNRKLPFDQISLAGAQPGMTVDQFLAGNPAARFEPVKEKGFVHYYVYEKQNNGANSEEVSRIFAGTDQKIFKITMEIKYHTPLDQTKAYIVLFKKYGYEDVSNSKSTDTFSNTYCWYGCERTLSGNDHILRFYKRGKLFLVELYGYSRFHLENGFKIPDHGRIYFTLSDGALEQQNLSKWQDHVSAQN